MVSCESIMNKPKILVCGDVEGNFKVLFSRVENINKKNGPFDILLCVGNFFCSTDGLEPYRNGTLTVPVPTYILGPNTSDQAVLYSDINGGEICPNISYLGKRGLFTGISGLKVAYLSGIETESGTSSQNHSFTANDVESVKNVCLRGQHNFRGIDILVTSSWPKDIMFGHKTNTCAQPKGSFLLSWLAAQVKPRYHFCGLEKVYYERPPYRNHSFTGDTAEHATRFIALAKVGNPEKQKWLYALSLEPIDQMRPSELYQVTTDQTNCPYSGRMLLQSFSNKQERTSQFFYDMDSSADEDGGQRKKARRDDTQRSKGQPPVFDQESCWFCLASAAVEKHLVISIGTEVYLALAKGGMVPDHVLILPVGHHQSLSDLPQTVEQEIDKFKSALKKFFKKQKKVPVFFERNYKTSHLQIQVVPVPRELSDNLKRVFQESAEQEQFQLDELPTHAKLSQIAPPRTPYFYVELPSGEKLFHRVRKNFPIQFGREVLASEELLDMGDRGDWKDCKITKEEEIELAKQFRCAFESFDFTL